MNPIMYSILLVDIKYINGIFANDVQNNEMDVRISSEPMLSAIVSPIDV